MAIGKWISFGQGQPSAPSPAAPSVLAPVVCPADAKQFGLENFGNTCYANSVLQALYFCGPFRELLVQYPDPSAPDPAPAPPPTSLPAPIIPLSTSPAPARRKPERKHSVSLSESSTPSPAHTLSSAPSPSPRLAAIPAQPPTLLSALRSLYLYIARHPGERGTVAPRAFIEKLRELNELFRGSMHQDAHEFLNFLLNKIVEEMEDDRRNARAGANGNGHANGAANGHANGHANVSGEDLSASIGTLSTTAYAPGSTSAASASGGAAHSQPETIVHRLFEGVLTSETRCLTCETVSARDESFLDLSIDIEQNASVTACLRQFSASEMLCQKNKFFCDSCCDLQEAEKRMKIKKLPNVLALHLKRFKYQEDVGKYIKLAYRVAFPLELRLFNTVDDAENPDRLYELFAIVVHIGNGPHHGHYVTIIKARGTWLLFDDDAVEVIKESDIPRYYGESSNGSAYVLYYQAVDLDMAALGLRPSQPSPVPSPKDVGLAPAAKAQDLPSAQRSEHDLHAPALPPGLAAEEPDSSDKSDSPPPATPASQPLPLSQNHAHHPAEATASSSQTQMTASKRSASPHLPPSLVIPSPTPGPHLPPQTPTPSSSAGSALGGLFHTLRHSQSLRVPRPHRGSWVDPTAPPVPSPAPAPAPAASSPPTASGSRAPKRPATAQSTLSVSTTDHSTARDPAEPASPRTPHRAPEKKPSMWMKWMSPRLDPADGHAHASSRRLSEAGIPAAFSPSPQTATAPSSPVHPREPYPEHKMSSPELVPKARSGSGNVAGALPKLPKRPSTAGATVAPAWTRGAPPVPPLPGSPLVPEAPGKGAVERTLSAGGRVPGARDGGANEFGVRRDSVPIPQRAAPFPPSYAHGAAGFSGSNSTSSTASGSIGESPQPGVAGAGVAVKKRASRKLSFTAPMLGFGRREKEKEKERHRESMQPPNTYLASR